MGTTFNKAIIAAFGPPAGVIMNTFDAKFGWDMGPEFWSASLFILFGVLGYYMPNKQPTV